MVGGELLPGRRALCEGKESTCCGLQPLPLASSQSLHCKTLCEEQNPTPTKLLCHSIPELFHGDATL